MKFILDLYKGYYRWIILIILMTFFLGSTSALIPYGTKLILDFFLEKSIPFSINIIFIILISIILTRTLIQFLFQIVSDIVGSEVELKLRLKVFKHIQKLPPWYFKNNTSGNISSIIIHDISEIKHIAQDIPENIVWVVSVLSVVTIISAIINIKMFYVLIIISLVNGFAIFITSNRMRASFKEIRKKRAKLNQEVLNNFHGIIESKSFNNEKFDFKRFKKSSSKFRETWKKAVRVLGAHDAITSLAYYGSLVMMLVFGFFLVQNKELSISNFILFQMYSGLMLDPFFRLSRFIKIWNNSKSAMERITKITNTKIQENKGIAQLQGLKSGIKFKNVSLLFDKQQILNNISFEIKANKQTAFVGHSGGGKTTIINIIMRFIDSFKGSVLYDGKSIKDYELDNLRSNIAVVQQNPFIFPGTLYDNIKYGNIKAKKVDVIKALKKAQLFDFVSSHKQGYKTIVGENGVKLSGGQRQRVAIARAFLKNPNIIILDEATSALDNATERKIQKALSSLLSNRTSIVIAHRLNTVINSDKIILISSGQKIAEGTHNQLIKNSIIYRDLQGI